MYSDRDYCYVYLTCLLNLLAHFRRCFGFMAAYFLYVSVSTLRQFSVKNSQQTFYSSI